MQSRNRILNIWSARVPYSLDPLDYDALAHHICFRSLYSTLVTDYKLGEIKGIVAESWSSCSDQKKWSFNIRKNLKFTNGDVITAKDVALSLNRAALLMKKAKSESGLLEKLVGFDSLAAADNLMDGISVNDNTVNLTFDQPMHDVLEKIGFGLYAIVSSKNYNSQNGIWTDKKQLIGSGPYRLENWSDTEIKVSLRAEYPAELLLKNVIQTAIFRFNIESISSADLIVDFDDSLITDNQFKFYGPVKSAIRYVECEGWKDKNSVCHNILSRKKMRKLFYDRLDEIGFSTVKSFFPMSMKGISEFSTEKDNLDYKLSPDNSFVISKIVPGLKSKANDSKLTPQEAFELGMSDIANKNNIHMQVYTPNPKSPISGTVDFRFRMTAILVDSPKNDILFMFKSEHGIRLPDETGEIRRSISNSEFSPQVVNQKLWDQAIIWPLGHMALGLWKKENTVSFSSYNLVLPPLDLQWIEWE